MFTLTEEKISEFIDMTEKMLDKSYSPYSKFPVASVIITECGKIFTGCNVENASYGLCICAERTAAVKAVSEGYRKFKYCFVMVRTPSVASPCGACRQFLSEFNLELELYLIRDDRAYKKVMLKDMLPMAFTPSELKSVNV